MGKMGKEKKRPWGSTSGGSEDNAIGTVRTKKKKISIRIETEKR